jgi:hypothetical protein
MYVKPPTAAPPQNGNSARPIRDSHLSSQGFRLESEIKQLGELVVSLEDRLTPVLRSSSPEAAPKDNTVPESLVPFADRLRDLGNTVEGINVRITDILGRLEV